MPAQGKPFLVERRPVLCRLGIHSWGAPHVYEPNQ